MWRRQRRVYRPDVRPDRGVPLLVVYYQRQQPLQRVVREFLRWVRELRHQDRQLLRPRGAGRLVIDHKRIAAGENVYYVSRQLGHASTKLTLDTYGRWLPARSTTAGPTVSGRSGDQSGVETVTNDVSSAGERA